MSELDWKPLANPGKHKPPWCDDCNDYCGPADGPCRCCLAAEVEAMREKVERVRDGVNVVLQRAQGVREFGGRSLDWVSGAEHAAKVITDALDGDDE